MSHQLLPKEEWTKTEDVRSRSQSQCRALEANIMQDFPYLTKYIEEIETEMAEREDLESMVISKRQSNAKASH